MKKINKSQTQNLCYLTWEATILKRKTYVEVDPKKDRNILETALASYHTYITIEERQKSMNIIFY